MSDPTTKRCSKCEETKSLDLFPRNRAKPDGRGGYCKACRSAYSRDYRLAHPEQFARYSKQDIERHGEIRRRHSREQYARNPEPKKAKNVEWLHENPDKRRVIAARYRNTHGDKLRTNERAAKKRAYRADPTTFRARVTQWARNNRDAARAIKSRRRARKAGNGGSHTAQEWQALKAMYDYRCLRCGKCEPEIVLTEDHVIPISLGGSDAITNIQPLCLSCNCSKRATIADYR